uniref:Uncharacterized protein n=1 Tax=Salix viminalis TaxID=40686 RepID=A0A6N2MII0_SALVM
MKFDGGILEIPPLRVQDNTGIYFRNLQAFEQCDSPEHHYIGSECVMQETLEQMEGSLETELFQYSMGRDICYCSSYSPHTHCYTSSVFCYSTVASTISIVSTLFLKTWFGF